MTRASHSLRSSLVLFATGAIACLLFGFMLDHRTDYVGHFAAGFGGTLGLLTFIVACVRRPIAAHLVHLVALLVAVISIGLGTFTEATIFRLAQFDPIDFCNQSLGAVLAALAFTAGRPAIPMGLLAIAIGFFLSILFLIAGFILAFA